MKVINTSESCFAQEILRLLKTSDISLARYHLDAYFVIVYYRRFLPRLDWMKKSGKNKGRSQNGKRNWYKLISMNCERANFNISSQWLDNPAIRVDRFCLQLSQASVNHKTFKRQTNQFNHFTCQIWRKRWNKGIKLKKLPPKRSIFVENPLRVNLNNEWSN